MEATLSAVSRPRRGGRATKPLLRYGASVRSRDPRTLTLTALIVALAASIAAFAHLAEDYLTGDPIVRWDVRFALWLHDHAVGALVSAFKVVTLAGNSAVLGVLAAALAVALVRRRLPNEAALVLLAFAGAAVGNALLKLAFHRPRPELAFIHLDTYSFPSGHAAAASATFTTLAYLACRVIRSGRARAGIVVATVAAIALVDFSRLYLGAHYLSDVLAGTSFGVAWATLSLIGYTLWGDRNVLDLLPRSRRQSSS